MQEPLKRIQPFFTASKDRSIRRSPFTALNLAHNDVTAAGATAPSGGVRVKVMTLSLDTVEPRVVRKGPLEA